jgi:hypothetical protein
MTKKEIAQAEAVKTLKEWGIVDGTTIHAKVVRVSASGMSRHVRLYFSKDGAIVDISYWGAKALEWGYAGDGYNQGIRVSGCGMDMLFHTVYCLSYAMGYGALDQTHSKEDRNINKEGFYGLKYKQL